MKIRASYSHKDFCPEHYMEIRNYELAKADNFVGWVCHHRNGEEFDKDWLIANNLYFNRTDPFEFIFLPVTKKVSKRTGIPTHRSYHARTNNGIIASKKHADSLRGKPGHKHTEEHKKYMSKIMTGKKKSAEHCKHLSEAMNNSMTNVVSDFSKKYREHYGISKRKTYTNIM